jgi:hypothetical protein
MLATASILRLTKRSPRSRWYGWSRPSAAYTQLTHIKDAVLFFKDYGLDRQVRACGDGVIDRAALIGILVEHNPTLRLSLEDTNLMPIHIYDATCLAAHPDLTVAEVVALVQPAVGCEQRLRAGEIPHPGVYQAQEYEAQQLVNLKRSRAHLRHVLAQLEQIQ